MEETQKEQMDDRKVPVSWRQWDSPLVFEIIERLKNAEEALLCRS